ncbi:MAG TPA: serine O-acetyltransferase [Gemmatimonadales bacterium]|jgi:serine O-acetyltransferase|nr:serine O-acetyltransferase [Gemmatimonadales bacterium]
MTVTHAPAGLDPFLSRLCEARRAHQLPLQLRELSEELAGAVLEFLFPHFARSRRCEPSDVAAEAARIRELLLHAVGPGAPPAIAERFFDRLPTIYDALLEDADALYLGDPAARSRDEVILAYPGFFAVALYRVAHALHELGAAPLPRLLTEFGHRETGIDIHPAARIGARLAIDHGTGIVIGETAVLGDGVKLYQGVTLGAASVRKELSQTKRHPTIGDGVVIYANATILGGDTVVGSDSIIGGNVWLTHSVPPRSVVTHTEHVQRQRSADDLIEFHL